MPEWAQYFLVTLIVVAAFGFVGRSFFGKKKNCGCGPCDGCG